MGDWLTSSWPELLKTAAASIAIMAVVQVLIRMYGLRSLAKMSSVDFASTIATGSVLASVAVMDGTSVLQGTFAIGAILSFQMLLSWAKRASDTVENLAENNPIFLMKGSEILEDNLVKTGVTRADLMGKLREANVLQLSQVQAVVFETTGDVSVLHSTEEMDIDDEILFDVRG